MDLHQMDDRAKQYFYALPASLQEQLMQSGVQFVTQEELERCCQDLLERGRA